jgi:hypothetical protein
MVWNGQSQFCTAWRGLAWPTSIFCLPGMVWIGESHFCSRGGQPPPLLACMRVNLWPPVAKPLKHRPAFCSRVASKAFLINLSIHKNAGYHSAMTFEKPFNQIEGPSLIVRLSYLSKLIWRCFKLRASIAK